ncbi:MAG: hypothetical protein SFW66_10005 [Gammaproteobacteria bacterium]|nr:hypothetical protein [Gammaproteobacteria bacterium]
MPISKYTSLLVVLLLTGCAASLDQSLDKKWHGRTGDQIIEERGKPTEIKHAANGHTFYIYYTKRIQPFPYPDTFNRVIVAGRNGTAVGYAVPNNPTSSFTLHCETIFELNDKNQVIKTRAEGGCVP